MKLVLKRIYLKLIVFITAFLFVFSISNAQDLAEYSEINVIPPSPNAAAFQKFVEVPVSLYTGTPNISVPIYEIKMGQLSLPISLQYHASGLKVDEHASWVGAGWSLNAGGMISRTAKGLPDELNIGRKGFFYNSRLFKANGSVNMETLLDDEGSEGHVFTPEDPWTVADSVVSGVVDLQPDLFVFNFPGGSGKFTFPVNTIQGNKNPVKYTDDDIKILQHPFENSENFPNGNFGNDDYIWRLQTADGTVYTFEIAERTQVVSYSGNTFTPYNPSFGYYQSSWQLTEIENNGEWIKFEYQTEYQNYERNYSETTKFQIAGNVNSQISTSSYSNLDVISQRLSLIYTSEGDSINFIAENDRIDLDGSKRLDFISIYKGDFPVKFYELDYSYFGSNYKLKLNSIFPKSGLGSETESLKGFDFTYYSGNIPPMGSNSQDFWGYYNGKTNPEGLIPDYKTDYYHINRYTTTSREPDLSSSKIGTLKSITYPTGGQSIFEYELNSYFSENYKKTYEFEANAINTEDVTKRFTVSQDCSATLFIVDDNALDSYTELRKWNGNDFVKVNLPQPSGNRSVLSSGEYELFAHHEGSGNASIKIEYEQEVPQDVNVGGLRVKQITSYDPINNSSFIKHYEYEFDSLKHSSGVLFTPPIIGGYITSVETGTSISVETGTSTGNVACMFSGSGNYMNLSSYTQVPLGIYNGSHIGYSEVKEYIKDSNDNTKKYGYTQYSYLNKKDNTIAVYPYLPNKDYSYINGKLKSEVIFENRNSSFFKVKSIDNFYTQMQLSGVVGNVNFQRNRSTFCYEFNRADYSINEKFIFTMWNNLKKKEIIEYDENEAPVSRKIYEYEYDTIKPLNLPKTVISYSIDQDTIKERYLRDSENPALVKEYKKLRQLDDKGNYEVISGRKINYHGKRPEDMYSLDHEKQMYIWNKHLVYDENQIQEITDYPSLSDNDGDLKTSYIFGYQKSYPIVEGVGIDYNTLSTAVEAAINNIDGYSAGLADLDNLLNDLFINVNNSSSSSWSLWDEFNDNLRSQQNILNVQINTYTYQPGVGITSKTDTNGITNYFVYDHFNRLKSVKDQNMNIIKEMNYQYWNQD